MKSPLFKSRKFLIMLVDVVVSITTYFVTKYSNPEAAKDVLFLIGAIQPVIIAVIASIAVQNVQYIKEASWRAMPELTTPPAKTEDVPQ